MLVSCACCVCCTGHVLGLQINKQQAAQQQANAQQQTQPQAAQKEQQDGQRQQPVQQHGRSNSGSVPKYKGQDVVSNARLWLVVWFLCWGSCSATPSYNHNSSCVGSLSAFRVAMYKGVRLCCCAVDCC